MNHDTKVLVDLATTGTRGMGRGRAMSVHRRLSGPSARGRVSKQRQFLEQLLEEPREAVGAYDHPRDGVSHHVDMKKTALLPSDIAWLDRLPKDPAKVSVEDARTLRSLLGSLKLGKASESDRRLVLMQWNPVKALHDRGEAEHNLELASRPLPGLSSQAISAVTESLLNEDSSLDEEIAGIHAQRMLEAAAVTQASERDRKIRWAQQRLDKAPDPDGLDDVDDAS